MLQTFLIFFLSFFFSSPKNKPEIEPVEPELPQGYFTFPISPGTTTSLSGSFGGIRVNHFHAGLDIRTGGRIGKSVFAAAEGYVSRIGVSRGGYGNALYITHPNGYTTVYGHLNEFMPKIKKAVLKKQYELQKWQVDLYFAPNEIPVKKAEMVAYSGNTGGSGGPHLHFEIRDEQERTLDPALFGFREIKDIVPPHMEMLSVVCKSPDARINGKFGTVDFPLRKIGTGKYAISGTLNIQGEVGFEVYAYDKAQTTPFKLGIKEITTRHDQQQVYKYRLNRLSFYNKLDMNMHTNYERMLNDRKKFHKAYYEEGNSLGFYEMNSTNGLINFTENGNVRIDATDTYGNTSTLDIAVQNKAIPYAPISNTQVETIGKFLYINAPKNANVNISSAKGAMKDSFQEPLVFDLTKNFINTISINEKSVKVGYNALLGPDHKTFKAADFELNLKETAYQNHPVRIESKDGQLILHEDVIPLKGRFDVKWNPNYAGDKTHTAVYLKGSRKPKFVGGKWQEESMLFNPKEFGTYLILEDITAPSIKVLGVSSSNMRFKIDDNLSGIKDFNCYVNGEWVLMEYEYKNGQIWSEKLDNSKPFKGKVDLYVTDNSGNQQHYTSTIN